MNRKLKNQLTFLESKHDYCSILDYCEKHDCRLPIYIVGGTNDTLSPEVISKYNGLTCICQSWTNLIDSGKHTIDEPTISFVFPLPAYSMTTDYAHLIDDKEYNFFCFGGLAL